MTGSAFPAATWIPYCGTAPEPTGWLGAWNVDVVLLALVSAAVVFAVRTDPARTRSSLMAAAVFLVLYVSPLCAMGSALFTVRALHHVALALVLAPLLVRASDLERLAERCSFPVLTALQAVVFWFWHAPPAYAAALSSDIVFWIMQASLIATAALWWAALRRAEAPAAVAMSLATMVQMGALGALLTFAGRAFYAPHNLTTQAWGWTPLEDQQIAGLIMWAPASAAYLLVALAILYRSMQPALAR
ncbi:cytochrome c oxidase assembly protein [Qipengyuania atrilutea]|uniref:Cytochrome c oxidase assembly protein n=1 Tax=Qipengyuania atrilutea TaxID=2744473 RepID=A0A850H574_9SPHN|nr:cytochrome c oxidase assembly protein [Actirhodobacter atriluteus]NVD45647.1 cytochrome c oxidase assembly protein [Actirhodobacter atriluteus]